MIRIPLIVYTHSDMEDVWPMFFGQLNDHVGDTKVYVAIDKNSDKLSDYTQLIYDDSKPYTERWKTILNQIPEDTFIFLHEDMILFDDIDFQSLEKYIEYVENDLVKSIKLISAGNEFGEWPTDKTLVTNHFAKFSIQPTIVKKDHFRQLIENLPPLNIWDFESAIEVSKGDFMVRKGNESKRGLYHYDSKVFPYIATAICKGKWNISEYPTELTILLRRYGIDPTIRGMV
jgi:hypothetical protein